MKQKLNCVLLIDDDEPTNFMSSMLLDEANCAEHIEIAESGQNALNYLAGIRQSGCENDNPPPPDLIFLDINMPAMNGWEFLEKYKELQKGQQAKIIIIMLTTSLNPDDKLKALQMPGISGFENKPLTTETINRIIKQHFTDSTEATLVTGIEKGDHLIMKKIQ